MSTPNAMHSKNTPSHLAFSSPAPRSVPSPAAQRGQQSGKSPFPTSQPPSSTIAATSAFNHPTASSTGGVATSKLNLGSSPAPGMINFDSPAAMALSLSNMGGIEGGVPMGISMSQMSGLGLGLGMNTRANDEEERRRRLQTVVAKIGQKSARVSKEGVARLARRLGLPVEFEAPKGKTVAAIPTGNYAMLFVDFQEDLVHDVRLMVMTGSGALEEWTPDMLKKDLMPSEGGASINHSLDRFTKNLTRLVQLDKLSTQEVNCFEAITGIHRGLKRLYEHEKKAAAKALADASSANSDAKAEAEVMCNKSGKPMMNANGVLGLSLQYWKERRHVHSSSTTDQDFQSTDEDTSESDDSQEYTKDTIFSLSIECESSAPELYPSIRVSDEWISKQIEKPATEPDVDAFMAGNAIPTGNTLDWLDPPPTYQPHSADQPDALGLDAGTAQGKLPNVRFIAKLDPPLVLPTQAAMQVLNLANVTLAQDSISLNNTYTGLLLPGKHENDATFDALMNPETRSSFKDVLVVREDGVEEQARHEITLTSARTELGRVLEELPFDHPRQLIQALPTLRQYAQLNTLLKNTFGPAAALPTSKDGPVDVDIQLSTATPTPQLSISFDPISTNQAAKNDPMDLDSFMDGAADELDSQLIRISLAIGLNGDIKILDQNVVKSVDDEAAKATKRLASALDVSGDLDVWVEWVRGEASK